MSTLQTQDVVYVPTSFAMRKQVFLKGLLGSREHYKRYVGSPLRYAGGKSLAVGLIIERMPNKIKRLVSPFLGGGAVEIACSMELGLPVVAYDIFDLLINYWDVQLHNPNALYERLAEFEPTDDEFRRIKGILKLHWTGEKKITNKLDLAALYYFNHNTSYGPHFLGWPSHVYLQRERYQKLIDKVRNFKDSKNGSWLRLF